MNCTKLNPLQGFLLLLCSYFQIVFSPRSVCAISNLIFMSVIVAVVFVVCIYSYGGTENIDWTKPHQTTVSNLTFIFILIPPTLAFLLKCLEPYGVYEMQKCRKPGFFLTIKDISFLFLETDMCCKV